MPAIHGASIGRLFLLRYRATVEINARHGGRCGGTISVLAWDGDSDRDVKAGADVTLGT